MAKSKAVAIAGKAGMGVYDLMQSESENGKWDKKQSVLQRTHKVSKAYADLHNENFKQSGSYYILNEKEHDKFMALVAKQK